MGINLKTFVALTAGGCGTFAALSLCNSEQSFYKNFVMPVVHKIDPEKAHRLAVLASKYRVIPKSKYGDSDSLKVHIFGREFPNPVGIAAGFDKDAEAILGLSDIGFGFVEIGSVTPEPQPGNEKPRVFRLVEDGAVINRYGFNSEGHDKVLERIQKLRADKKQSVLVGINLGKNKTSKDPVDDYVQGIKKFGSVADYLVINISSPNTPGLRKMQDKDNLRKLLRALVETRNDLPLLEKPHLLLKLAPDLSMQEKEDIADVLRKKECRVDGLIVSNTTIGRPPSLHSYHREETGGRETIEEFSQK
ncbi:hypothetical protein JTB14_033470 [Gonioctena quinquepunctata]|nr:hypothetical protein JTB14_033470 [Gonioctena quinquepunctata]